MFWKLIRWLLPLTLIGGLIASNALTFSYAYQYYVALNSTRLDPLGLAAYPTAGHEEIVADEITAVFVGDSRAFQWLAPTIDSITFINRGIGAQTTAQVKQRYGAHVTPLAADFVIIQAGINDLKTLKLFPNTQEQIISQTKENISQLAATAAADGSQVILTSVIPVRDVRPRRRPFWSPRTETAVIEVNQYLADLAKETGYLFLDAAALLAGENGRLQRQYAVDELHLNDRGYQILNEALIELLDDQIEEK